MRSPNSSRFFADVAKEIETALIQLKNSTTRHERLALVRDLRSLLFLLGFTPVEKQQTAIPLLREDKDSQMVVEEPVGELERKT